MLSYLPSSPFQTPEFAILYIQMGIPCPLVSCSLHMLLHIFMPFKNISDPFCSGDQCATRQPTTDPFPKCLSELVQLQTAHTAHQSRRRNSRRKIWHYSSHTGMRRSFTETPQRLLDLHQQKTIARETFVIKQANKAISLLQAIETDARPCCQGIFCVFRVFDFESAENGRSA
jgi:hypothetical protein